MSRAMSRDLANLEGDSSDGHLLLVLQSLCGRWCDQGKSENSAEVELGVSQHGGVSHSDQDGNIGPNGPQSFNARDMIDMPVRQQNGDGSLTTGLE